MCSSGTGEVSARSASLFRQKIFRMIAESMKTPSAVENEAMMTDSVGSDMGGWRCVHPVVEDAGGRVEKSAEIVMWEFPPIWQRADQT